MLVILLPTLRKTPSKRASGIPPSTSMFRSKANVRRKNNLYTGQSPVVSKFLARAQRVDSWEDGRALPELIAMTRVISPTWEWNPQPNVGELR